MKTIKVGLLGIGTVGGGTVRVLKRNAAEITRRLGSHIRIVHAATRDPGRVDPEDIADIRITDDAFEVVDDPEIDIVVELIGGYTPARELVLKAIENGKHVVTANKALIANYGNEIFEAAQAKGVMVAFEAAVGGGIPIIKSIREGLTANRIEWVAGIINGTGNYVLTEMRDSGREFADVLADALRFGYAEADPTFDVEGIDAAHKITILASIAFGIPLQFDRVYTEGITKITREDVVWASELGYGIKHLGIARRTNGGVEMRVHPTLIPHRRLIANVDGVMNAILVNGDAVGPTLYYGPGAGSEATASAVIADLVDVVRALETAPRGRVPNLAFQPEALSDLPVLPMDEVRTAFYLRLSVSDRPGVLADITRILSDHEISIESILQKEADEDAGKATIILLTHLVREGNMNDAINDIESLDAVMEPAARIRLETLK